MPALTNRYGQWNVAWDFTKFVFDHTGKGYKRFDTEFSPYDMERDIKILLQKRQEDLDAQKRARRLAKGKVDTKDHSDDSL